MSAKFEQLDALEEIGRAAGSLEPLLSAAGMSGLDSWADVIFYARDGHPVAIELLCRRVERGL